MVNISKCLVLGGAGFLGSYIVDRLAENSHEVMVFDLNRQTDNLYKSDTLTRVRFQTGNFSNDQDIKTALKGIEYVFHLISTTIPATSNQNPIADIESNIARSVRLLELCKDSSCFKKIIFLSSGGTIYGRPLVKPISENHPTNPICSYGISKLAVEKYIFLFNQLYGFDYAILRCSAAYGERQNLTKPLGAIGVFVKRALDKKPIVIWGNGETVRDFIYADDVASACILAMKNTNNKIFNVGSGSGITLNRLMRKINNELGINPVVEYQPSRTFDVSDNTLDINLIRKELGWSPTVSLNEGIRRVWKTLHANKKASALGNTLKI